MFDRVRAFGRAASDLDVAFGALPADESTTEVLSRCLGADGAASRDWTLARRLQALLAIRLADDPAAQAPASACCAACGAGFELEIDLARCVAAVDEEPVAWSSPDGHVLRLRLPRASDLQSWRARQLRREEHLAAALLLSVDGKVTPADFELPLAWVEALADRLAERDPFTALDIGATCPDCGAANNIGVDIETLLLHEFAAGQRRLLDEVAALARAFHWTEAQILELPAWRRAYYLNRLDGMGAA